MATNKAERLVKEMLPIIGSLLEVPNYFYIDYDKGADVAYISLDKPQNATDSKLLDDGMIIRKRGRKIVGLTILHASKFIYG